MSNRRSFIRRAFGVGAGVLAGRQFLNAAEAAGSSLPGAAVSTKNGREHSAPAFPTPVVTTDVGDLSFTMDGNVKVFHLVAQVVRQKIALDKTLDLWGFNGSAPGPTMQVNEGDRVRVVFDNQLPEQTSIHWHGFEDSIDDDGEPGVQAPVKPGGRFIYEFTIHQQGTYFYHSHMGLQQMTGMLGGFIMHPKDPCQPHCDKDFLIHLQEYAVLPDSTIPNTMSMEYNWLLLNGKAGPDVTPLIVRLGDRVRIRFVNLGMDHHPMHIHGHTFHVTGTEGGRIPESAWWPGNTVLVGVGQARDIEFLANNSGDWMLHCHLPHHMMNQMASTAGQMTRQAGVGMPAGGDMRTGMGILGGVPGVPMSEDYGQSLGRGMGFGSTSDNRETNGPLSQPKAMAGSPTGTQMNGTGSMAPEIAPNANDVPNFPQDAYMEGPAMTVDQRVARPENYSLVPGWSRYMQGMMTYIRVLPPDRYDAVILRMKQANRPDDPYASLLTSM